MTDPIRNVLGNAEAAGVKPSADNQTNRAAADHTSATSPAGVDSVDVAQTRSLLETINATVGAVPTVNQDRVSALRQALASGSYRVNPQQVAKQLLSSERALPNPAPPND